MKFNLIQNEEWRKVLEYPYEVSNFGRVRRIHRDPQIRRGPFKLLKPSVVQGYCMVVLYSGGKKGKWVKVHRLVAVAFLGDPPIDHQVNHKDGIKVNNHVDNLEWVTISENEKHAYRLGLKPVKIPILKGESNGNAVLTKVDVAAIRASQEPYAFLAKKYGVSRSQIWNVKNNYSWKD